MPQSNDTATRSRNRLENAAVPEKKRDGEYAARLLKFKRQAQQLSCVSPVPFLRVSARGFYNEHKAAFDGLASFFDKHGLDLKKYMEFFADNIDNRGVDLDRDLMSKCSLEKYSEWMHGIERRSSIYGWFMKSARNLARMCLDQGYASPKDCLLAAIKDRRMSQLVVSGQLSMYFLAAIPGFRNVIPKLDRFARDDLAELYDRFDMYSTDVNEALLAARNRYANPFKIAQDELMKLKESGAGERVDDGLFDDSL